MAIDIRTKKEQQRRFFGIKGDMSEKSLESAGYEGVSPTGLDSTSFIKAILWCNENVQGEVQYMGGKFWFTDNKDATAFKMIWL